MRNLLGGDLAQPFGSEGYRDVEGSPLLGFADGYLRHDDAGRIGEGFKRTGQLDLPALALQGGEMFAQEVEDVVKARYRLQGVAPLAGEAQRVDAGEGGGFGGFVAHKVVIEVVGIGDGDIQRDARRRPRVAIASAEFGTRRDLRTAQLKDEARVAGGGGKEVGRDACRGDGQLRGKHLPLGVEEGNHAGAGDALFTAVEGLEGGGQEVREGAGLLARKPEALTPFGKADALGRAHEAQSQNVLCWEGFEE